MTPPTMLLQDMLCTIDHDIVVGGTTLRKGTEVFVIPQTIAACVLTPENTSLAEAWASLSRVGHVHAEDQANLATFSAELTRYAARLSAMEAWAAQHGWIPKVNQ